MTYDDKGNRLTSQDPLGRTTTQAFDRLHRVTSVIDPFNGASAPIRYGYNGQDQLTGVPSVFRTIHLGALG